MEPVYTSAARLFTLLFIFTAAAYIGVAASARDIVIVLRDRKLMLRVLLANILLVPVLGLALVRSIATSHGDISTEELVPRVSVMADKVLGGKK